MRNWPPPKTEEFVPLDAPESLPDDLETKSFEEIENQLNAFVDGWSEYASQHNIFISDEKRALVQNREQALATARELAESTKPRQKTLLIGKLQAMLQDLEAASKDLNASIEANDTRLNTFDATPKEVADELPRVVQETVEEQERIEREMLSAKLAGKADVAVERQAALDALSEREPALKEYLKAQAAFKKIKKPTEEERLAFDAETAKYGEANEKYTQSQLAYVNKLQESVKKRLESRYTGEDDEHVDKILARYNRTIRLKEIVIPGIKQSQKVREDLLNEKGRNIFQKGLKLYQNANKWLEDGLKGMIKESRFGKNMSDLDAQRYARMSARAVRIIGFAATGAGVGLLGGVATGTVLGASVARLGVSASGFVFGSGGGFLYGKHFMATKGKKRAGQLSAMHGQKIESAEDLAAQQGAYELGSDEAIDQARTKRENIFALVSSLGISGSVVLEHAAHVVARLMEGDVPVVPPTAPTPSATPSASSTPAPAPESTPTPVAQPDAPVVIKTPEVKAPVEPPPKVVAHTDAVERPKVKVPVEKPIDIKITNSANAPEGGPEVQGEPAAPEASGPVHTDEAPPAATPEATADPVPESSTPEAQTDGAPDPVAEQPLPPEQPSAAAEAPEPDAQFDQPEATGSSDMPLQPAATETPASVEQTPDRAPMPAEPIAQPEAPQPTAPIEAAPAPSHEAVPEAVHTHGTEEVSTPNVTEAEGSGITSGSGTENAPEPSSSGTSSVDTLSTNAAPENLEGVFTNKLGVRLNPNEPHLYETKGKRSLIEIWGGTPDQQKKAIADFFNKPENFEKELYSNEIDPITKKVFVNRYWGNYGMGYLYEPNLRTKGGGIFGLFAKWRPSKLPPPEDFQRIIQ